MLSVIKKTKNKCVNNKPTVYCFTWHQDGHNIIYLFKNYISQNASVLLSFLLWLFNKQFFLKVKQTRFKIYYINKTHKWKNLFINKLHFYVLITKSLYIIFIIKHVDLTCPLAKPERSRVQSLLKLSADTDPYCWPTAVLPKHHFNTCLGSVRKRNRKEYI